MQKFISVHISTSYFTHDRQILTDTQTGNLRCNGSQGSIYQGLLTRKEHWLMSLMYLIFNSLYFWSREELYNSIQPRTSEGKSWGWLWSFSLSSKTGLFTLSSPDRVYFSLSSLTLSLTHSHASIHQILSYHRLGGLDSFRMDYENRHVKRSVIGPHKHTHSLKQEREPMCHSAEIRVTEIMHDL